mmetsp:Transcript_21366/g.40915  ORF Transcript_21366/g.40915 Transcript_21366/m.40915 type:complete len:189 (-) Transcript_21366:207-773(-)
MQRPFSSYFCLAAFFILSTTCSRAVAKSGFAREDASLTSSAQSPASPRAVSCLQVRKSTPAVKGSQVVVAESSGGSSSASELAKEVDTKKSNVADMLQQAKTFQKNYFASALQELDDTGIVILVVVLVLVTIAGVAYHWSDVTDGGQSGTPPRGYADNYNSRQVGQGQYGSLLPNSSLRHKNRWLGCC